MVNSAAKGGIASLNVSQSDINPSHKPTGSKTKRKLKKNKKNLIKSFSRGHSTSRSTSQRLAHAQSYEGLPQVDKLEDPKVDYVDQEIQDMQLDFTSGEYNPKTVERPILVASRIKGEFTPASFAGFNVQMAGNGEETARSKQVSASAHSSHQVEGFDSYNSALDVFTEKVNAMSPNNH